jgi:hypothetical protein
MTVEWMVGWARRVRRAEERVILLLPVLLLLLLWMLVARRMSGLSRMRRDRGWAGPFALAVAVVFAIASKSAGLEEVGVGRRERR